MSNIRRRTSLLILVGSIFQQFLCEPLTLAKSQPLSGFVEEVPQLDGSVGNSFFQLNIEHNEVQRLKPKPILKSKEQLTRLRIDANEFKLQSQKAKMARQLQGKTDRTGVPLQGKVDRNGVALQAKIDDRGTPLQGKVDDRGAPLQGKVDDRGTPLRAGATKRGIPLKASLDTNRTPLQSQVSVTDTPRTPLETVEHHVRPPFHVDLQELTTQFAPDIQTSIDLELQKARIRTAEHAREMEHQLDAKLKERAPHPDMPPLPRTVQLAPELSKALNDKIAQAKISSQKVAQQIAQVIPMQRMPIQRMAIDRIPLGPMNGSGTKIPELKLKSGAKIPSIPSQHSETNNINKSVNDMEAALARAHQQHPASSNLTALLEQAKNKASSKAAEIEPGMDAVLTHARAIPVKNAPAIPKNDLHGDATTQDVVPWDEWHSRFANLARGPILANISKAKTTSGADTIEITVWRDHRLEAKLSKPSNSGFDAAILSAYKSLAGNANLEFPKNSVRQSITFLVDNEHKGAGVPSAVQSQSSVGDKEVIRRHL